MKLSRKRIIALVASLAMILSTILSTGKIGGVFAEEDGQTGILTELNDKDKVVLFDSKSGMAVTDTASGKYLAGVKADVTDGKLTKNPEAGVFEIEKTDAGILFKSVSGGKYITAKHGENDLYMSDKEAGSVWELMSSNNGFKISNTYAKTADSDKGKLKAIGYKSAFKSYTPSNNCVCDFIIYRALDGEAGGTEGGNTTNPDDSGNSGDPGNTTDPTNPTDPGNTTDPTNPSDPGSNTDPADPANPADPADADYSDAVLKDGAEYAIYSVSGKTVFSATADGKNYKGEAATVTSNKLAVNDNTFFFTVKLSKSETGETLYSFVNKADNTYLSAAGNKLGFVAAENADDYTKWQMSDGKTAGSYRLKNLKAKYKKGDTETDQYLENYKGDFTLYSASSNMGDYYDFKFFDKNGSIPVAGGNYEVADEVFTVAQWGGNATYDKVVRTEMKEKTRTVELDEIDPETGEKKKVKEKYMAEVPVFETALTDNEIHGDKFEVNDMLSDDVFTSYISGKKAQPYSRTTGSGGNNYNWYMGAENFGKDINDYLQFKTSSAGYGNMNLSFRLRMSNAGPNKVDMVYSTDGGKTFKNIEKGTYYVKFTPYVNGEPGPDKEYKGEIKNGILPFPVGGQYVSYTVEMPKAASNADSLIIRIKNDSDAKRIDGKTAGQDGKPLSISGSMRVDSFVLTGSPVINSGDRAEYVHASLPSGHAEGGTEIELTSETEGASIYYSMDNGQTYNLYNADEKVTLAMPPVNLMAYAAKDGLKNSITSLYQYTAKKCAAVKGVPNGGGIAKGKAIALKTATEGAEILYAIVKDENEEVEEDKWLTYEEAFVPEKLPCIVKAKATKSGCPDSAVVTLKFTERKQDRYNIYFGQVHAHTNYSDGAGTVDEAFKHAKQVSNLDFLAITDHSNALDNADDSDLTKDIDVKGDGKGDSINGTDEWTSTKELANKYTDDKFTAFRGFEMTWSNGLGHINTFNTPGFQSRTQKDYKTYSTALNNYYNKLEQVPDSISQFNHPGTTFGDFQDFAYYTDARDNLITMIEVGNGEGTIGSSGYFPSYEYYQRALDKGWHVAPTNNQDNHKGHWGDANTARTVMLSDENNETSIYDAMRNYRIYASEDYNLSIYYTLDDYTMGSILEEGDTGDKVHLKADIKDADANEEIGKVQVIVNGGIVIDEKKVTSSEATVEFDVDNNYSFYYLKVFEKDGDIAVTAPVWVGKVEACGINKTSTTRDLPVAEQEADINVDFYNNEKESLFIDSITLDVDGNVIKTADIDALTAAGINEIKSNATGSYRFMYAAPKAGKCKINVTANARVHGVAKVYKDVITLNYTDPRLVGKIVIDGSHANDYVSGSYAGNMKNITKIAAEKNLNVVIADKFTEDTLKDASLLIVPVPARKDSKDTDAVSYKASKFEDSFIETVKNYVDKGGSLIVCGLADYSDSAKVQASTELNKLLSACGATMKINSDEVWDDVNNGGQQYRMYPTNFNTDSEFLAGIVTGENGQKYSQYSGCSIDITNADGNDKVEKAVALVRGFDTTRSVDCKDGNGKSIPKVTVKDKDGKDVQVNAPFLPEGQVVFLAEQPTKAGGHIFAAGGVFMSDFEVKAGNTDGNTDNDKATNLPYANETIIRNILKTQEKRLPVSTIAEARKGQPGDLFSVEGYVTSGTANPNTTFFDTIYIQDETGGIDVFPYAESGMKIGTHLRVTGTWDQYQGDTELRVINVEVIDDKTKVYKAKKLTTKEATDYDKFGGSYVKTTGKVTRVQIGAASGELEEFWLADDTGVEAAIFIDGYIKSGTTGANKLADVIKVGKTVTASGILYMHPEGASDVSVPVFRVKDCDEIVVDGGQNVNPVKPSDGSGSIIDKIKDIAEDVANSISNGISRIAGRIADLRRNIINRISSRNRRNQVASSNVVAAEDTEVQDADEAVETDDGIGAVKDDSEHIGSEGVPKTTIEGKGASSNKVVPIAIVTLSVAAAGAAGAFVIRGKKKGFK